jgi:hypothetical protein
MVFQTACHGKQDRSVGGPRVMIPLGDHAWCHPSALALGAPARCSRLVLPLGAPGKSHVLQSLMKIHAVNAIDKVSSVKAMVKIHL